MFEVVLVLSHNHNVNINQVDDFCYKEIIENLLYCYEFFLMSLNFYLKGNKLKFYWKI